MIRIGQNNVYVLDCGEGLVLIDAGPNLPNSWELLKEGLTGHRYKPLQIRSALLTHAHGDHSGQAHQLQREVGATVMLHQAEAQLLAGGQAALAANDRCVMRLLAEHGVPKNLLEKYKYRHRVAIPSEGSGGWVRASRDKQVGWVTHPTVPDHLLSDGELISFGRLRLKAIHCPGHSPGSTVFYQEESKIVFSGDHVLKGVTPSPTIFFVNGKYENRVKGLADLTRSLQKIRDLPAERVLPGHGEEMTNLAEGIDRALEQIKKREERVLKALINKRLTAFEILPSIFPNLKERGLWLAIYAVIGHLDILLEKSLIVSEPEGGKLYHRMA